MLTVTPFNSDLKVRQKGIVVPVSEPSLAL